MDSELVTSAPCPRPTSTGTFEDLLKQHGAKVTRWVARSAPSQDRKDLVQEVLLAAYLAWPRFRGEAMPSTWLFSITDRIVLRTLTRERRLNRLRRRTERAEDLPTSTPSPARRAEVNEQMVNLRNALEQLPARYRKAYTLHEFEGVSTLDIAMLLGTTENNVWLCLHRARKQLRAFLLDANAVRKPPNRFCVGRQQTGTRIVNGP